MRNFIVFVVLIFLSLFIAVTWKNQQGAEIEQRPVVKVFGSTSFTSQWGPGPWLKERFERSCDCRLEYYDGADNTILLQRLKAEGRNGGADVVLGFDQYDLEQAQAAFQWKKIDTSHIDFFDEVKTTLSASNLVPYDWGTLSFVVKKSEMKQLPKTLNDFLAPEWKGQIVLEDPRTSSPGLQFLVWLIQLRGEEQAFDFLKKFNAQLHSYAPSWSSSYGLFQKGQVKTTFSYVTSPVYHLIEDKSTDVIAVEFEEGHPIQFEFIGIPATCKTCDLAEKFVQLVLSKEGQKIIMEKNYMFPAVKGVKEGTAFSTVPKFKTINMTTLPTQSDRERILKKWSALRRLE